MKERKIKVIIVDKNGARVEEIVDNLDTFYSILNCDCIEIPSRYIVDRNGKKISKKEYDFIIDGEGALKDITYISCLDYNMQEQFCGYCIITRHDRYGNQSSLSDTDIESILKVVQKTYYGDLILTDYR